MVTTVAVASGSAIPRGNHVKLLDSNSDGDIFALIWAGTNDLDLYVSTDDGSTWTKKHDVSTTAIRNACNIFVSSDDYVWILWQDTGFDTWLEMFEWDGSTITSKASLEQTFADTRWQGGLVAHPLGSEWYAHYIDHDQTTDFRLRSINVTAAFSMTLHSNQQIRAETGTTEVSVDIGLVHTGDGKTLSGDPDLWVGFRRPTSTEYYFHKYAYSSSPDAWTKGTERSVAMNSNAGGELNAIARATFDGTDFVISSFDTGSTTEDSVKIWYRDNADTTTTTSSASPAITSADLQDSLDIIATSDGLVVYVVVYNNNDGDLHYIDYTKSGDSWGTWTSFDVSTSMDTDTLSTKHHATTGTKNTVMSIIFDSVASTWDWTEIVALNSPPTATITSPTSGTNQNIEDDLEIVWTYNDADSDAQSKYSIRRVADAATTEYWNGTGWVSSESGATEISGAATSVNFGSHWGDPSSVTSYVYSVKVHDGTEFGAWSTGVTIFPTTTISTNRGFALPRPYKKQENLNAVLKSNTDYMLSWINNYVPAYGDLNDDLYLRAGVRAGGESEIRDAFPPVVGEFDIGNATNYFNAVGAVNVYRTNEIALSSGKAKKIYGDILMRPRDMMKEPKVKAFKYKDEKRNAGREMRFGLVAEDVMRALGDMGINPYESSLIQQDDDGNIYLVENQLIYLLWHAVQELQAEVEDLRKDKNK